MVIAGGCCAIADSDIVVWLVAVGCSDGGRLLLLMDRCGAFDSVAAGRMLPPLDAVIVLAVMLSYRTIDRYLMLWGW